jgi:hypothetical protein
VLTHVAGNASSGAMGKSKLVMAASAALVWDSRRLFEVGRCRLTPGCPKVDPRLTPVCARIDRAWLQCLKLKHDEQR